MAPTTVIATTPDGRRVVLDDGTAGAPERLIVDGATARWTVGGVQHGAPLPPAAPTR